MADQFQGSAVATKPSSGKKRSKRRRRRAKVAASLVPLGFIGAFFTNDGVQQFVCESRVIAPMSALTSVACDEHLQQVDVEEANLWLARYVGRSSGQIIGGWKLLSTEAREEITYDQWASGWEPIVAGERVGGVTKVPGQFNTFHLVYRTFQLPSRPGGAGWARTWEGNFEVRRKPGGDAELTPRDRLLRVAVERPVFPRVRAKVETKSLDSPVDGPDAMDPVPKGATLTVLCVIDVPNAGWWVRTDVGFIGQTDLDTGPGRIVEALDCDSHYAILPP